MQRASQKYKKHAGRFLNVSLVPSFLTHGPGTEWLLSFLKAFPISQGKTLFENLKLSLIDIYVDIAVLCNSFLDEKLDIPGKFSFPIATGMSWKSVKSLQDIPLTNANAVQISVLTQKALLEDLVCELDEYRQQAGSQDDGWKDLLEDNVYEEDETPMTSEELETVRQVQSVAKLCIVLFKKLDRILANSDDDVALQIASLSLDTPDLDTPGNKYECMDNLVPACANITRILDDVACQLQSPLPILEISTGIKEVTDEMKDICTSAAGIISDSERGWFDLMCTKIEQIKLSF